MTSPPRSDLESLPSRLVRQGGIYALGNVALKASGLLLAIIYLNPEYLSQQEFGYYGLLLVTAQFGTFVAGMGLSTGMLKFMTDSVYDNDRPNLPFTIVVATALTASAVLVVLWVSAEPFARLMLDTPERAVLIRLMAVLVAFKALSVIPLTELRVKERAGLFAIGVSAEMILLIAGAWYLVVVRGLGLYGLLLAHAVAAGVTALVLVGLMLARVRWRIATNVLRPLLRFGAPLVLVSLSGWMLNAGDRYLLKWLADAEAVGLYEWASRIAGLLNLLLVQSFYQAFSVLGLKSLGQETPDATIHRTTFRHYVMWAGWAAAALALFSYDITRLLPSDAGYLAADDLVLFLALGFVANGVYHVVVNLIYSSGRTQDISVNVAAAAILNVVLNLLLIPRLGVVGAALATFVSYFALAGGAAIYARRGVTVQFPWRLLATVVILVACLYVIGLPSTGWSTGARLALRTGLVLAYPAVLMATRLLTLADLRRLEQGVRQAFGRSSTRLGE